jgi:hypothetical protein
MYDITTLKDFSENKKPDWVAVIPAQLGFNIDFEEVVVNLVNNFFAMFLSPKKNPKIPGAAISAHHENVCLSDAIFPTQLTKNHTEFDFLLFLKLKKRLDDAQDSGRYKRW